MRPERILQHPSILTSTPQLHPIPTGSRHMAPQHQSRITHHHQNEIDPDRPQRANHHDAADALRLQDPMAQTRIAGGRTHVRPTRRISRRDGLLCAARDTLIGRHHHIHTADIVFRTCKPGGRVHHLASRAAHDPAVPARVVLAHDQEPCDAEGGGVSGIDDGVDDKEDGEGQAFQGGLVPDVRGQVGDEGEGDDGVDVHGELQGAEVDAGQDGEEAVEAGDFVEEEREGGEFGAGAKSH